MNSASSLQSFRLESALASGGISSGAIKKRILALLDEQRATGRMVDVGAGRGELLALLSARPGVSALAGIDIMPRPEDLPPSIAWTTADLNDELAPRHDFDVVICSENIEHLENPRRSFRNLRGLLAPGGLLVLTMPNQESLRSYVSLVAHGHFTAFRGSDYPAHITALLRLDLLRMASESGFAEPHIGYVGQGAIPGLPRLSWQQISFGLLRGRLFSDNLTFTARAV